MDDDIQADNKTINNSNTAPEVFSDDTSDIDTSSDETMETRTRIFLDGPFTGQPDEVLVNKIEATILEDGFVESTDIRLKTANACGHVLHTGSEAGLRCVSCSRTHRKQPLILCGECAKNPDNICYVCNSVCCWRCRKERRIDGEKRMVCEACVRTTLRIRLVKRILEWLAVAGALFYLLMF